METGGTFSYSDKIHPILATKAATLRVMKAFDLHAGKRLGQNFLIDKTVIDATIDAAAVKKGDCILEIGPGIGTLTQGLLEAGATVTAVEADKKLPAVLAKTLAGYKNFRLIEGDVLKTDVAALMGNAPFKAVANLPYYITTPILLRLLTSKLSLISITVMVQKEVAERMTAKENTKEYGALSVAVQYFTAPQIVRIVPPDAFFPPPKVKSAVVRLDILPEKGVSTADEKLFFRVVRAAFGQRRKTLANALKGGGFDNQTISAALKAANIEGTRRGETLSLAEFAVLSDCFAAPVNLLEEKGGIL